MDEILLLVRESSELKLLIVFLIIASLFALVTALIKARHYFKRDAFALLTKRRQGIDETLAKVDDLNALKIRIEELETKVKNMETQLSSCLKINEAGLVDSDSFAILLENHTNAYNMMTREIRELKTSVTQMVQETIRKVR